MHTALFSPGRTQREAAAILYARLILREGPATVEQVADELGICHSSVTRQCTGDIPVQVRTLTAMLKLDPDGGRLMLDELLGGAGLRWTDEPVASAGQLDAIAGAWRTVEAASDLQGAIARGASDGHFDASEREDARNRLARMEHRCKAMRAQLDALEPQAAADKTVPIRRGRG